MEDFKLQKWAKKIRQKISAVLSIEQLPTTTKGGDVADPKHLIPNWSVVVSGSLWFC